MFSFFSKKNKNGGKKGEPDRQALFNANLAYISRTTLDTDCIERQFVKTSRRNFLTVGSADCPTGSIIVSDPLAFLATGEACPRLSLTIPPGTYPVEVSICRNSLTGIRMCTARLKIRRTPAVKYVCAQPTEDSAAGKCSDGLLTGFPVDAGMISFCDAAVANEYRAFLARWHRENEGKNHYDDYFAGFFAESARTLPDFQRDDGDFIEWTNPDSSHKMVMVASGFGDGFYQCFWGYDSENEICELTVPLVNPDLFESAS